MTNADRYRFLRALAIVGRELGAFIDVKRLDELEEPNDFDNAIDVAAIRKGEFVHRPPPAPRLQVPSPSPLLSRQRISVGVQGELVVLAIGNTEIKMPYETALQLSQWMRVRAKEAKRMAGDTSRHFSGLGTLVDLER